MIKEGGGGEREGGMQNKEIVSNKVKCHEVICASIKEKKHKSTLIKKMNQLVNEQNIN